MDRQAVNAARHRLGLAIGLGLGLVVGCGPGAQGTTVADNEVPTNAAGSAGASGVGGAAGNGTSDNDGGAGSSASANGGTSSGGTGTDGGMVIGSHAKDVYMACYMSCAREEQMAQDLQCGFNRSLCESDCTALETTVEKQPIQCFNSALAVEKCIAALPPSSYTCSQGHIVVSQQQCESYQKAYDDCLAAN